MYQLQKFFQDDQLLLVGDVDWLGSPVKSRDRLESEDRKTYEREAEERILE